MPSMRRSGGTLLKQHQQQQQNITCKSDTMSSNNNNNNDSKEPTLGQYFETIKEGDHQKQKAARAAGSQASTPGGGWANFSSDGGKDYFSLGGTTTSSIFSFFESSSLFRNHGTTSGGGATMVSGSSGLLNNCNTANHPPPIDNTTDIPWMEQLFPITYHTTTNRSSCGYRVRRNWKDRSATTLNYQFSYRAPTTRTARTTSDNHDSTPSDVTSSEHLLSNEDWIRSRRHTRDRWMQESRRRRVRSASPRSLLVRSSVPQPMPTLQSEGELLLGTPSLADTDHHRDQESTTADTETPSEREQPEQEEQLSPDSSSAAARRRMRRRRRARRMPVTSGARRERWNHHSVSAARLAWRVVRAPWRGLISTMNGETRPSPDDLNLFPEEEDNMTIGRILEEIHLQQDEEDAVGFMSGYWSTGTAMETLSDSDGEASISWNGDSGQQASTSDSSTSNSRSEETTNDPHYFDQEPQFQFLHDE